MTTPNGLPTRQLEPSVTLQEEARDAYWVYKDGTLIGFTARGEEGVNNDRKRQTVWYVQEISEGSQRRWPLRHQDTLARAVGYLSQLAALRAQQHARGES